MNRICYPGSCSFAARLGDQMACVTGSGTPVYVDYPRRTAALCLRNAPTAVLSNILRAGIARQFAAYRNLISDD